MDKVQKEQPKEIQLDRIEILELENLHLKIERVEQDGNALLAQREEVRKAVEKRLGIENLTTYIMDIKTGKGRLAKGI